MKSQRIRRPAGIGLVDLMVGLAIGLLAMLVILKVTVLFESRRRSTTGIADAQMNAASAILMVSRELRIAGQGLGPPDSLGCSIVHDKLLLGTLSLQPVEIVNGSSGKPDKVRVLSSGSPQIVSPTSLIAEHPASAVTMYLGTTLGIEANHQLLLYESGKNAGCALLEVTAIPLGAYRADHKRLSVQGVPDYMAGTRVINLGSLRYAEFSVDTNDYLQVKRYFIATDQWRSAAMASEVVSLQAQYGFDTQAGTPASTKVTRWSDIMVDADGDGNVGDNDDLRRLIALRLAIVVRSAERSDQGCNARVPQWMAGDEATGSLMLTDIKLDHVSHWRCYRYRVLQTEVPLRNLLWSDA